MYLEIIKPREKLRCSLFFIFDYKKKQTLISETYHHRTRKKNFFFFNKTFYVY